ncbi:MAG: 23S rRNA (guanosine(2251)-2'-O)-methyltransferase RlmB [Clostridia bacterium]|nr:23S rRNA (guanosine(2251)-2'-O)-methyltransferase RlmB [Clostridia bacterium]
MDEKKGQGGRNRRFRDTENREKGFRDKEDKGRPFTDSEESGEQREKHSDLITGRNAVTEALKSGRPIESLLVARSTDSSGRSFGQIIAMAREMNITVKEVSPAKLDAMCGGSHQGIAALTAVHEYSSVDDIFALAESRGEAPFVILCDGIEDPHNLGAIIRTAEAAGAHGVIIPKRRAVGLTWAVGKASAGALEYMPVARVANLSACIEDLKKRGLWIYCADMDGQTWCNGDLTGAVGLVIGGEDSGVSRLVREKCDGVLSLPMKGSINSLNASVACAIVIYEITRQRSGIHAYNQ